MTEITSFAKIEELLNLDQWVFLMTENGHYTSIDPTKLTMRNIQSLISTHSLYYNGEKKMKLIDSLDQLVQKMDEGLKIFRTTEYMYWEPIDHDVIKSTQLVEIMRQLSINCLYYIGETKYRSTDPRNKQQEA